LLSKQELENLVGTGSLQGLIAALTQTAYRKSIDAALTRASGMACIADALHNDTVATLGQVSNFYLEKAGEMVAIVLLAYDVHNLKTILRGLATNTPPGEILAITLPVGRLESDILAELVRTPGPRGVIDLLATMNLPFAEPLLALRAEYPGAETFEMELALDRWYYRHARRCLRETSSEEAFLCSALNLEADLANLLTVLRFVNMHAERKLLHERSESSNPTHFFIGPGILPFDLLAQAARQDTLKSSVELLAGTLYASYLNSGLEMFAKSGRLSDFEKELRRYRLRWMSNLITKDPLGIGVLLGYLALKTNEIGNLRWIAQGINLGLKAEAIRTELELAT
jgi:V/A-type H+-transporting ATPase subunit C